MRKGRRDGSKEDKIIKDMADVQASKPTSDAWWHHGELPYPVGAVPRPLGHPKLRLAYTWLGSNRASSCASIGYPHIFATSDQALRLCTLTKTAFRPEGLHPLRLNPTIFSRLTSPFPPQPATPSLTSGRTATYQDQARLSSSS